MSVVVKKAAGLGLVSALLALLLGAFSFPVHAQLAGGAAPQQCPPLAKQPSSEEIQKAQSEARDRGFLWRISKGGKSSYLYGTLHVGKLAWALPGPQVRAALSQSELVALELDVTQPETVSKLQAALVSKPGDPEVDAALLQGLRAESAAACLPAGALDGQKPAVRAMTLMLLAARWDELDASFAQEAVLTGYAESSGRSIVALETVEEQISALLPQNSQEANRFVQQALTQLKSGTARRGTQRLAQAWADGKLEELANYEQWCECVNSEEDRQMLRRLNDDRNPALASRIDRLHGQGRSVFAGVGALHMTGPKALPLLLRQRGFTVERISFAP